LSFLPPCKEVFVTGNTITWTFVNRE